MARRSTAEERARARGDWPVSRRSLRDSDPGRVASDLSTAERWAIMWELTLAAWAFRAEPLPDYERAQAPLRLIRPTARDVD